MTDKFKGQFGWAERHKFAPGSPGTPALLSLWFMHLPHQAVGNAWSEFMLGVCHLRHMQGVEDPIITKQGATHELTVIALEPGQTPRSPLPWKFLTPTNICTQFRVSNDLRAQKIAEDIAHACVDGLLIAESSIIMLGTGEVKLVKEILDQWDHAVELIAEHFETGGHHGALN